jgi:hypothetical protein
VARGGLREGNLTTILISQCDKALGSTGAVNARGCSHGGGRRFESPPLHRRPRFQRPSRSAAHCFAIGSAFGRWAEFVVTWDFTTPTGVALIAAVASFVAGLFGPTITSRTMSKTHSQRLAAEEKLAERRFEFDKELSQHKSDAD